MTGVDRESAMAMLHDADLLRAEAATAPLTPAARRRRHEADRLVASARRLLELVAQRDEGAS